MDQSVYSANIPKAFNNDKFDLSTVNAETSSFILFSSLLMYLVDYSIHSLIPKTQTLQLNIPFSITIPASAASVKQ